MGNTSSSNTNSFDDFYHIIDYIASYYILTMDFKSLSKLTEKEYCDKLVVLTSDIIDRYFNDIQVQYLAQRIKDGVEVNEMNTETVRFLNKDNLDDYDISNDTNKSIKKKRVCIGIAKFYIKIAHIFSAIIMTINPVYSYKDETGQTVKVPLLEKDKIPKGTDRKLYKLNICDNRIRALDRMKDEFQENAEDPSTVTLQPKICDINQTKSGNVKTLEDEPGIPELMKLYLDDEYDYSTGVFTGMSSKTKNRFEKDLRTFYTVFTGNDTMPEYITKFSDIKLKDYGKMKGCQGDAQFKSKYVIDKKDELFVKYANNIKNMIQNAATNQNKLLEVINELFTYVIDPYSNKKVIRVNPKLTDELLQKVVEKTRRYIINLYINCEKDYAQGVKLFEAIVESKIIETTQEQISRLTLESDNLMRESMPYNPKSNNPNVPDLNIPPPPPLDIQPPVSQPPLGQPPIEPPIVEEKPFVPPPIVEEKPFVPPPIVEEKPFVPPPIVEEKPFVPPLIVEEKPFVPPPIVEENPFVPPPIEEKPFVPPPPIEEKPFVPPPPIEEKPFVPPPPIEEKPFVPPPPIEEKPFVPPPIEEKPFVPPPPIEEKPFVPPPIQEKPIVATPKPVSLSDKKVAFGNPPV